MRILLIAAVITVPGWPQTRDLPLASAAGLTLHQAEAKPVEFKGRKAIQLTRGGNATGTDTARQDHLAILDGLEFGNGRIEVDLAGEPAPGAGAQGARGFVGIAFRVQPDRKTYDCVYVRPTNGRADDQERRNHSVQYISHPVYTWMKLRQEFPSKYEAYADIEPAQWIRLRIDVRGERAEVFVNGVTQPTLIVKDVKTGAAAKGAIALWIEGSTIAHFANLRLTN